MIAHRSVAASATTFSSPKNDHVNRSGRWILEIYLYCKVYVVSPTGYKVLNRVWVRRIHRFDYRNPDYFRCGAAIFSLELGKIKIFFALSKSENLNSFVRLPEIISDLDENKSLSNYQVITADAIASESTFVFIDTCHGERDPTSSIYVWFTRVVTLECVQC